MSEARTVDRTMRFVRSRQGSDQIRCPTIEMRRPARNLLLAIDATHTGWEWVNRVRDCTVDDLLMLAEHGLLDALVEYDERPSQVLFDEAVEGWSDAGLRELLARSARERLGLFHALRFVLEVERCEGRPALLRTAQRFIELLEAEHGPETARRFRQRMAAGERTRR